MFALHTQPIAGKFPSFVSSMLLHICVESYQSLIGSKTTWCAAWEGVECFPGASAFLAEGSLLSPWTHVCCETTVPDSSTCCATEVHQQAHGLFVALYKLPGVWLQQVRWYSFQFLMEELAEELEEMHTILGTLLSKLPTAALPASASS